MFTVTKQIEFDAGHRVPRHEGQCRSPHGHRYRVTVTVTGAVQHDGPATGMVVDFADIKTMLVERVHDIYDHAFIVWESDRKLVEFLIAQDDWKVAVVPWHPTAENLANAIFLDLDWHTSRMDWPAVLEEVVVWETPTSAARVQREVTR